MAWQAVLDELVRDRGRALVGHAYLLTGDLRDAEDLVQDALVKVFAGRRASGEVASAEAYVRRAIHTLYIDGFRRRRHWATIRHLHAAPDATPTDGPDGPTDLLVGNRLVLAQALAGLSPRERTCVVLHHVEDLPVDEIAALLSLSTGAVKRYLSDGRRALRERLGDPPDEAAGSDERLDLTPRRTR
ncbi:sigma-70 family RNA polymerase sigma factor [Cellulomonas sp. DKR-3]|uniref:Sigma-70 family RNA polymerase sigma factor n=1 Tax=Cellulomonas fulva TaxID=2835530 RepID=A0ABS5TYD7_9CELL|nr:sigma-70 family RNA polymerase sigma factor [Cellulomonas fulva]MBT0994163.1 sigma-70 family RNA polymerase sigma factor [Cellulomonas fulva]